MCTTVQLYLYVKVQFRREVIRDFSSVVVYFKWGLQPGIFCVVRLKFELESVLCISSAQERREEVVGAAEPLLRLR